MIQSRDTPCMWMTLGNRIINSVGFSIFLIVIYAMSCTVPISLNGNWQFHVSASLPAQYGSPLSLHTFSMDFQFSHFTLVTGFFWNLQYTLYGKFKSNTFRIP